MQSEERHGCVEAMVMLEVVGFISQREMGVTQVPMVEMCEYAVAKVRRVVVPVDVLL
jgi:hypothetical protein